MTEKTKGIFLHYINYSDSSVIARVYTEKFGQQAYLVNGVRSKKSGAKINLFQPLFFLDMEVSYKAGRNLQRIREIRLDSPFLHIPFDIKKSSQAIFIAEVLMKCLKEEEPNRELFDFLIDAIHILDMKEQGIVNFVVVFMFKLTKYLGVFPRFPEKEHDLFFDLVSASFKNDEPAHNMFMNAETTKAFTELFSICLTDMEKLRFTNRHRTVLLARILEYYKIHIDFPGEIKSFAVLKDVLG